MPRFFVPEVSGDHILVTGGDARHISYSLRMATGDDITFCNNGKDYFCKIESFSEEGVLCKIISSENSKSEPDVFLTLYQALPKGDKFETIIQKSIELGASRIVPVMTKRCVSRPDDKSFAKKLIRYNKIAEEAAKQSGRGIIPEITPIMDFDKVVKEAYENDLPLICYEREGGKRFSEIDFNGKKTVSLIIGSEGGFDASEAENAVEKGIIPIWLGERILRCETAPVAAISIIMNLSGNI
mgnify:CR=1 FL=1